jgi:prepilin-type N-terminal cleavage/methylation domain-containing protein
MTRKPFTIAGTTRPNQGFTLTELLVSVFVLVIIVFMVAQLMTSATTIARPGSKHISTDTQARVVLDRIALDFAQMLKRTDVDYYVKGPVNYQGHNGHGWGRRIGTGQQGSDQIAFFTQVPGYYPASGAQSPISLVAYRVNQSTTTNPAWMRLERLAKGLRSNGYDPGNNPSTTDSYPIVFLPQTIIGVGKPWAAAINNSSICANNNPNNSCDSNYEIIGPGVFRMEYYYILKNGQATDVPWDRILRPSQTSLASPVQIGLTDVEAIGVVIAVIDPEGRALMDTNSANGNASMLDLASDLADFRTSPGRGVGNQTQYIGQVESSWETTVESWASTGLTSIPNNVPKAVASAIRIYSRTFDLKTLPTF